MNNPAGARSGSNRSTTRMAPTSNAAKAPAVPPPVASPAAASKATTTKKTPAKRKRTPRKGTTASKTVKTPAKQPSSKKKKARTKPAPPPPPPAVPPGLQHALAAPGQQAFVPPPPAGPRIEDMLFMGWAPGPPPPPAPPPAPTIPPGLQHSPAAPGQQAVVPPVPREDMPRDMEEFRLLAELAQMGFPDRREILQGIRATKASADPGSPLTAEAVMLFMVTFREEQEEAKKMDQARLESESFRVQQEQQRAEARKERLDRLATTDDLREVFEASWILACHPSSVAAAPAPNNNARAATTAKRKGTRAATTAKAKGTAESKEGDPDPHGVCCWGSLLDVGGDARAPFLKWLSLEGRCRKWYGSLPKPYFERRAEELIARWESGSSSCGGWLQKECEKLEVSLYSLEEQQGGVPKAFLRSADGIVENPIQID